MSLGEIAWGLRRPRTKRANNAALRLTRADLRSLTPGQVQARAHETFQRMADTWDCIIYIYLVREGQDECRAHATDAPLPGRLPLARICPGWQ